jgi:hypothetical protein
VNHLNPQSIDFTHPVGKRAKYRRLTALRAAKTHDPLPTLLSLLSAKRMTTAAQCQPKPANPHYVDFELELSGGWLGNKCTHAEFEC